jgi:TolA-binding protein
MRSKTAWALLFVAGLLGAGICLPTVLGAQSSEARLREGLSHFREGRYQQAAASFQGIIEEGSASEAATVKGEAYYWAARSYLALNLYDEAARNLELFLTSYPEHRLYPDALYQKGRLLFLQGEPENAILVFEQFLEAYPDHELVANALYWSGESLYSLGRLDEAARVFAEVVNDYPASFKVSDAGYRLSLIEFKKREDELMKLLKWSHEETLRVTEEFQRREKAYEQAIAIYQRRLSAAGEAAESAAVGEAAALRSENERLRQRITALETQLAAQGGQDAETGALYEELENRRQLLEAKAEALAVKEALLQTLAEEVKTQE